MLLGRETTPIMYLYCMCKNPPTKGRPWSEHRNGERQTLSMQCDSVLHDMYHQHANFLVALNCGGYFPRTSTKTRLFLFSSKQPLQAIYIYLCIYHITKQIWLLYIFVAWFFVQVSIDHILYWTVIWTNIYPHRWAQSLKNRLPQNLCDACTLRVVHIILHNCKFIRVFPQNRDTPKKWMVYNGKTLFFNGWFWGETHYFRKHPFSPLPHRGGTSTRWRRQVSWFTFATS